MGRDFKRRWRISPRYKRSIYWNAPIHFIVLLLSGGALDGGISAQYFLFITIAFWAGAILIMYRRPRRSTWSDLIYFRYGFLALTLTAWLIIGSIWRWRGVA